MPENAGYCRCGEPATVVLSRRVGVMAPYCLACAETVHAEIAAVETSTPRRSAVVQFDGEGESDGCDFAHPHPSHPCAKRIVEGVTRCFYCGNLDGDPGCKCWTPAIGVYLDSLYAEAWGIDMPFDSMAGRWCEECGTSEDPCRCEREQPLSQEGR